MLKINLYALICLVHQATPMSQSFSIIVNHTTVHRNLPFGMTIFYCQMGYVSSIIRKALPFRLRNVIGTTKNKSSTFSAEKSKHQMDNA